MEEVKDGKAIIIDYKCDVCGIGFLNYTGIIDTEKAPDMYQNKCNHCNNLTFNNKDYPTTRIIPADESA